MVALGSRVVATLRFRNAVVATGLTGVKTLDAVSLAWQPAFGATSYRVRVGTEPGLANLADVDVGVQTTLTVSTAGVLAGEYYVHVVAMSACGTGAPSNEVLLTLP